MGRCETVCFPIKSVYVYTIGVNFTNRVFKRTYFSAVLGASMSTAQLHFRQDPIHPPADVPSTLHRKHWSTIRTRQSHGNQVQGWYNYCLNSLTKSYFWV